MNSCCDFNLQCGVDTTDGDGGRVVVIGKDACDSCVGTVVSELGRGTYFI